MKREAVLINVARGPIVAERDLYEALTRLPAPLRDLCPGAGLQPPQFTS